MYEPAAESDEDCEVYFLKPVNEYNIVDKIKLANKELAETPGSESTILNRKVTFALNLEDYEPSVNAQNNVEDLNTTNELMQQLAELKIRTERFEAIPEEEVPTQTNSVTSTTTIAKEGNGKKEEHVEEEEEEICEEILDIVDIESSEQKPKVTKEETPIEEDEEEVEDDNFTGIDENDLDDDKHLVGFEGESESDQKSLTNLLTESDCEEEERTLNEARMKLRQAYQSLYKTLDVGNDRSKVDKLSGGSAIATATAGAATTAAMLAIDTGRDEDEDDLSIIVASYIPDRFELNDRSIYYKQDEDETPPSSILHKTHSSDKKSTTGKTFFNARKFSFRNKPAISAPVVPAEPAEPKLGYKPCCEHRNSVQEKLPSYSGYISEYGMSVQQLQRRSQQMQRKRRFALEQTLKSNEEDLKKMQDNERAFTSWLKNKMRYPLNKTRNMFDAKMRRGSVAAAATPRQQQQQQRMRSRKHESTDVIYTFRHLLGQWDK